MRWFKGNYKRELASARRQNLRGCMLCVLLICCQSGPLEAQSAPPAPGANPKTFTTRGVIKEISKDGFIVAHEAIPGYMDAMAMPFKVKDPKELAGLRAGDSISFLLKVTETESWVEHISRTATASVAQHRTVGPTAPEPARPRPSHPLLNCPFTNELGQTVRLADFRGQALALTFFFTRCPIPDYCPRLSKNFQEALQKLQAMPHAPTNWHLLSVSFDTDFDTPPVLRAYAERYHYAPNHWSFLTGPAEQIRDLARQSDAQFDKDNGLFNHNFRTLIIDATGHLQMIFPTSGDLSDAIVSEILKAAVATNRPS